MAQEAAQAAVQVAAPSPSEQRDAVPEGEDSHQQYQGRPNMECGVHLAASPAWPGECRRLLRLRARPEVPSRRLKHANSRVCDSAYLRMGLPTSMQSRTAGLGEARTSNQQQSILTNIASTGSTTFCYASSGCPRPFRLQEGALQ